MRSIPAAIMAALFITVNTSSAAETAPRSLDSYVWDLDAIYPTGVEWERERAGVLEGLARIEGLKAVKSSSDLARLLSAVADARGRAGRMAKVGLLQHEVDSRSEEARLRHGEGRALERRVEQAVRFVEPLLRKLGGDTLNEWLANDPLLAPHQRRIARTLALAPYAPQEGMEEANLSLGLISTTASDIFNEAIDADLAWPAIEGSAGPKLDLPAYYRLKRSPDALVRNEAAVRFLKHLHGYRDLFGVMLTRRIEGDLLVSRQRNLDDPTDLLLVNDGFAPQSHRALFAGARSARKSLARAAGTLAKLHGLERPTYTDLFVAVHPPTSRYPIQEALEAVAAAALPLGEDYVRLLRRRFDERWMHLPPAPHKGGTVGVFWHVGGGHPHAVMNYGEDYASARTLTGASILMMGYGSVPAGSFPDRREEDFPVFSNALWLLGPLMLDRKVLEEDLSPAQRAGILSAQLTWVIQSYVRNSLIAELESRIAGRTSEDQPLAGSDVSKLYLSLVREYFGEAVTVPDEIQNEWITHRTLFYGPHYASFAAAAAVAVALDEAIAAGDPQAMAAVRDGIGRSRTHLSGEVLHQAGIDLSNPATHAAVIGRIDALTEELTRLIDGMPRRTEK